MQFQKEKEIILIVDFGSQVTKLIARRVRDLGVYSEIINPRYIKRFKKFDKVKGIILSGGPSTVTKNKFQNVPKEIFTSNIGKYLKKLPSDFDMFFISPGKNNFNIPFLKRKPFSKVHYKKNIETNWGGHGASRNADAYFISKKCASLLVNEYTNSDFIDEPIDWWMNSMIDKFNLKIYWAQPTLVDTNLYETSFNIK